MLLKRWILKGRHGEVSCTFVFLLTISLLFPVSRLLTNPSSLPPFFDTSYVNVISTVRQIFETVEPTQTDRDYLQHNLLSDDDIDKWTEPPLSLPHPSSSSSRLSASPSPTSRGGGSTSNTHVDLLTLRYRLSPLMSIESSLAERLGGGFHIDSQTGSREMFVRRGWQNIQPSTTSSSFSGSGSKARRKRGIPEGRPSLEIDEEMYEASRLIEACKDDILLLWRHPTVQKLMRRGRIPVKESSDL